MINDYENAKIKDEQQYNSGLCGSVSPSYGDCCQDTKAVRPMTVEERRVYELSNRIAEGVRMKEQSERVLDILTRHPEFHEFLEVMRSGLI